MASGLKVPMWPTDRPHTDPKSIPSRPTTDGPQIGPKPAPNRPQIGPESTLHRSCIDSRSHLRASNRANFVQRRPELVHFGLSSADRGACPIDIAPSLVEGPQLDRIGKCGPDATKLGSFDHSWPDAGRDSPRFQARGGFDQTCLECRSRVGPNLGRFDQKGGISTRFRSKCANSANVG